MDSATTNQSETFNYVLKRLQEWKEALTDALALSLFRLSQYHLTEIRPAFVDKENTISATDWKCKPRTYCHPSHFIRPILWIAFAAERLLSILWVQTAT